MPATPVIDVKQAARAAEAFTRELYAESEIRDMRLEEVQLSDDGRYWLITLGWPESSVSTSGPLALGVGSAVVALPRVYKQVRIDVNTGAIAGMTIRKV